jgi:hypothetical protein
LTIRFDTGSVWARRDITLPVEIQRGEVWVSNGHWVRVGEAHGSNVVFGSSVDPVFSGGARNLPLQLLSRNGGYQMLSTILTDGTFTDVAIGCDAGVANFDAFVGEIGIIRHDHGPFSVSFVRKSEMFLSEYPN